MYSRWAYIKWKSPSVFPLWLETLGVSLPGSESITEFRLRLAEEDERMKREKEESEARERICVLEKVKEIAEQDPARPASKSPHPAPPTRPLTAANARDA